VGGNSPPNHMMRCTIYFVADYPQSFNQLLRELSLALFLIAPRKINMFFSFSFLIKNTSKIENPIPRIHFPLCNCASITLFLFPQNHLILCFLVYSISSYIIITITILLYLLYLFFFINISSSSMF